jgi:hypothetical protein
MERLMNIGHTLSQNRVVLTFLAGSTPNELTRCLKDKKKLLISAGIKADNIPRTPEQLFNFFKRLTRPTINPAVDIIRNWFRENVDFEENLPDIAEALEELKQPSNSTKNREALKPLWRSILRNYVSLDVDQEIISFLSADGIDQGITIDVDEPKPNVEVTREDAELCLSLAKGNNKGISGRLLPTLVDGMFAVMQGDTEKLAQRKADLKQFPSYLSENFEMVLSTLESKYAAANQHQGFDVKRPLYLKPDIVKEIHKWPILGTVKKHLPNGQFFVKVIGVLTDKNLIVLDPDEAEEHFPSTGDATALPGVVSDQHLEGELSVWKVEHQSPEKSTQYIIKEHLLRVFEVFHVPHPSSEPDKVRQWLRTSYQVRPSVFPVFELSDGLILRMPNGISDPTKVNYDAPLDAYSKHEAFQIALNRKIVASPFPIAEVKYDCAPLSTCIKRLFKARTEAKDFPSFSKSQLSSLVEFATKESYGSLNYSISRAKYRLEELSSSKDLLNITIAEVIQLPEVMQGIELEKEKVLEEFRKDKAREVLAIEELEELRKNNRQQAQELSSVIKRAYEKASLEGMDTLANASLIASLYPHLNKGSDRGDSIQKDFPKTIPQTSSTVLETPRDIKRAIERSASETGLSATMLSTVIAAANSTGIIGLLGRRSPFVTSIVADLLAGGVSCEVSVTCDMFGISDLMNSVGQVKFKEDVWTSSLGDFIDQQQRLGNVAIVELLGVNRAPPESFLPELFDSCFDGVYSRGLTWEDKTGALRNARFSAPAIFILNFVSGKSTFPVQSPLANDIPIIHSDTGWLDEFPPTPEISRQFSQVTDELWKSLVICEGQSHRSSLSQRYLDPTERRMTQAAMTIGLDPNHAELLSQLSLRCGRASINDLEGHIESRARIFLEYFNALQSGNTGLLVNHIFQSEIEES